MLKALLPGLPTLSCLTLAAMIAAAISIKGPIPVAYEVAKDFQPLIASLVAIGGACVLVFNAFLAYRAAMEKVKLDREISEREVKRRQRGVLLRARFDAFTLMQSAIEVRKPTRLPMPYILDVSAINLIGRNGIDDAWNKLEDFPGKISRAFSGLKVELFNFDLTMAEFGKADAVSVAYSSKEAASVADLVEHLDEIERLCIDIFKALDIEIADG